MADASSSETTRVVLADTPQTIRNPARGSAVPLRRGGCSRRARASFHNERRRSAFPEGADAQAHDVHRVAVVVETAQCLSGNLRHRVVTVRFGCLVPLIGSVTSIRCWPMTWWLLAKTTRVTPERRAASKTNLVPVMLVST